MFVPLLIIGAVGAVAHFEPCAGVDPNLNHLHQWCCCLALTRLHGAADGDCLIMRTAASGSPAWRLLAAVVPVLFSMAKGWRRRVGPCEATEGRWFTARGEGVFAGMYRPHVHGVELVAAQAGA